jgi:hypothetical protein
LHNKLFRNNFHSLMSFYQHLSAKKIFEILQLRNDECVIYAFICFPFFSFYQFEEMHEANKILILWCGLQT